MKVNHYLCDLCGAKIDNAREYKVTVKYPVPASIKHPDRYQRKTERTSKTFDVCTKCFKERFKEFVKGQTT